jgi:hypothetical protein
VDTVSKFLSLAVVGLRRLHPYHIAVGRVRDGAVDCRLAAALVPVVTLARASGLPVEVDIDACQALCDCACFRVAFALTLLVELGDELLLVHVDAGVDCVRYGFVEKLQVRFLGPCILDGLQLHAILASLLRSIHEVAERLNGGICYAQDVVMVTGVDSRCDQGGSF